MGFTRKMFILSTGGLGAAVVKPNSKKERIAKATEKQTRISQQQVRAANREARAVSAQARAIEQQPKPRGVLGSVQPQWPERKPGLETDPALIADELAKLADLRDRGVLTEEEFAAEKARLLNNGSNH